METEFWRDHLTEDERYALDAADRAKEEWQRLNAVRAGIVNRAVQRARYASGKRGPARQVEGPKRDVPLSEALAELQEVMDNQPEAK